MHSGIGSGLLKPRMPVKLSFRIPQVFVEIIYLTYGILEHETISVKNRISGHEGESHEKVIRPQTAFAGPCTYQCTILKTGLTMTDMLRCFLNPLLIIGHAEPVLNIDQSTTLCADKVQFIKTAKSMVRMPVTCRSDRRTHLIPFLQTIGYVLHSVVSIFALAAECRILKQGRIYDTGGVMPVGIFRP